MSWLTKLIPSKIRTESSTKKVPEGLWSKCPKCNAVLYRAELERNFDGADTYGRGYFAQVGYMNKQYHDGRSKYTNNYLQEN